MRRTTYHFLLISIIVAAAGGAGAKELVLYACKDGFMRSNSQTRNSGANEGLLMAHAPAVRTLMAFDLSAVTNDIERAVLRFRIHENQDNRLDLVVARMVSSASNDGWIEGGGTLGTKGQNARPGEACYAFCAFPDTPWESASGEALRNMNDGSLWKAPAASLQKLEWRKGQWIEVELKPDALAGKGTKSVTFGLWGTGGNGLYWISARESGHAPQLVLQLKDSQGARDE